MDKVANKEILDRIVLSSMEDLLTKTNLLWTVHILVCHQIDYQSRYPTLNGLLATERVDALVSDSRIPSSDT